VKLRTVIFGAFAMIAIITLIVGVVGVASTRRLANDSDELQKLLAESSSVGNVLNAHFIWRQGLTEAVLFERNFTGSLDPGTCALGKWLDSDEAKKIENAEILSLLSRIQEPHNYIHNHAKEIVDLLSQGKQSEAADLINIDILPKTQEVIDLLSEMQSKYGTMGNDMNKLTGQHADTMTVVIIVVIILAFIVCIILAWQIAGFVIKPIVPLAMFMDKAGSKGDITLGQADLEVISKYSARKDEIGQCINSAASFVKRVSDVSDVLETISNGDLTTELSVLSDNDKMGQSLQRMNKSLNTIFGEINTASTQVSSGAKQVADGAQSLAQGSTEQAASIEELSGSITEIAERTRQNAATANKTAKLSETIKESAEKGSRQMDEMITAVGEINEASKNISKIIKTIDDIAFQTNILALNAAVEAARAGQHGKGFAVVAEEVRNLASKSAEAARDTGDMIQNSMEKAELGSRIAGETAESLKEIVTGINESSELVAEIASASEQQSMGINQINIGIDQVAQVVQQNSATAEESAAASEEMSSQSDLLQQQIAEFKLANNANQPLLTRTAQRRIATPAETEYTPTNESVGFGKY